ncbi:MAG: hypothetical protein KGJ86_08445 [Chloroflexota bacterium]|nr:hypothetical protein [Chloroflexota bacterium]
MAMFTDKVDFSDVAGTEPEYQELLRRVLTIQADCEIGGPHPYVKDILLQAPTASEQLIVARTAAEEIDHIGSSRDSLPNWASMFPTCCDGRTGSATSRLFAAR